MKIRSTPASGRLGLVLAAAVGLVPAAFGQAGYGSPALYASGGTNPLGVAIGDLNGDGRPDLVTANRGSSTIGVLLAQATPLGTYGAAVVYAIPGNGSSNAPSPTGVALGDANGDGRLDIVTGNQIGTVSVLLNLAATPGTFAPAASYASGGTDTDLLALGDLNGDGRLDVAVTNNATNTVGVLLNRATAPGTFAAPALYPTGGGPVGVAIGDVNGDSRPDLVVGNNNSNTVSVLLNSPTTPGAFATAASYPSGGMNPVGVALGDVNGDGRPDLVVGNNGSNTVGVLLASATAAGTFGVASTYACTKPNLVALADVNGDGRPDLVAGNEAEDMVSVLPGQATSLGIFGVAATYSSGGTGPIGVALGDVNGDGRRDIVVTNYQSNTLGVLLNTYIPLASAAAQDLVQASLYPNPTHGAFTVQLPAAPGSRAVLAELRNTLGQVVRRQRATLPGSETHLPIEAAADLAPGVYLLHLQVGEAALVRRVVLN